MTQQLDFQRSIPIRVWHGTRDEHTPLDPRRTVVRTADGTVTTYDADHFGTLLDCEREAVSWLAATVRDTP